MSNLAAVQDIYDAFGKGDVPRIPGHLSENVVWESGAGASDVPWLQPRAGKEGAAATGNGGGPDSPMALQQRRQSRALPPPSRYAAASTRLQARVGLGTAVSTKSVGHAEYYRAVAGEPRAQWGFAPEENCPHGRITHSSGSADRRGNARLRATTGPWAMALPCARRNRHVAKATHA